MTVSSMGDRSIDYVPCRYNGSRLYFRGPSKALRGSYIACLGGCDVYGRYVDQPLSDILNGLVAPSVINLGVENAGVDAYLNDAGALSTAAGASVAIIQMSGCHNTSNRFYTVHPRRNDRFLKASSRLRALYPEMDFTEVHFTRHLLGRLEEICAERFLEIVDEAQRAWRSRMVQLMRHLSGKTVLLWFAPRPLAEDSCGMEEVDPFLTSSLVGTLQPHADRMVSVVPETWGVCEAGTSPADLQSARLAQLPGTGAHQRVAEVLAKEIAALV
ncbi:DUF6473 family protein [Marivita sp. S6314]|uniref:DUF6473 family protein n=1 Tax=Marivita sp. S6314 TaxID=2926406 RepID=UPI001FF1515F|nr:DUF6473 family protein [Marivita sp. S6314]MCK0150605.1 DUF6473 family protein [Marivita sp. S6314]